ncbi:MAG: rubrerythrin family protein [Desulfatiglans sp.]|jgi:rubrerythrin|nr:rubrerythrin family protein [Thermodesulfobacteriota bacterium]MEE4354729.1 rubrerythrin family protein [Desulfatiglans sp.]
MNERLKDAFYKGYVGEAKAALRLKAYAKKAEEEGYLPIAKLFRVIARSEEIHGERSLRMLQEIKSTEENLQSSFDSEMSVAGVAYDEFIKTATEEEDNTALMVFSQSRDVEEVHARLYKEAMNHLMEERDTTYHVCNVCGYISDGTLPDECPVCGAKKEQFSDFD